MDEKFTLDRIVRLVLSAMVFIALFYLLRVLSDVLLPFFIALLMAYLMNPIVTWIQKLVKKRILAIGISMLGFAGVLFGLWFLIVPALSAEYRMMEEWLVQLSSRIDTSSFSYQKMEHWILQYVGIDQIKDLLSAENMSKLGQNILPEIWNSVGNVFGFLLGIFGILAVLLYLVFLLMDFDKFQKHWKDYIPPKWRKNLVDLAEDLEEGMRAYFRQQSKIVLVVSILFAIGFKIIGLPLAITLGIFVGLLNYIPYMQLIGIVPCTLAAALLAVKTGGNFWLIMLWVAIVFSVVQAIQETVLIPKLMGNITGFSPAIILLSLSIWGALLGITGLIIALPVTTIIVSYYRRFILKAGAADEQ